MTARSRRTASGPAWRAAHALGPGETGEILLRNPVLTPGYWGMPEETAAVMTADGWLHTGDLATVNGDGTYTFVGRRKEVLRRRGENLSPLEVEEVLDSHPAVLESAVVGVASELTEEEIKAFVVATPGAEIDLADLHHYAAERLSAFKVPRFWQVIDGCRGRRPSGSPSTGCLPGTSRESTTPPRASPPTLTRRPGSRRHQPPGVRPPRRPGIPPPARPATMITDDSRSPWSTGIRDHGRERLDPVEEVQEAVS